VLDGGGGVRETRDYYPFGLPMPGRYEEGSPPTQEDFTGHVKDESTGLHYAGARYYSSAFGRWTTTDPILGEKGAGELLASGEGVSATQVAALGGDLAGLAVPFATGGGAAVRGAMKADDLADAANGLEKAGDAASATKKGEKTADAANGPSKGGNELETVFRVYGGDSGAKGFSWTPKNPGNVSNFRDAAGLPSGANNTGRFVIRGKVKGSDIIKKRPADPLDGNSGGLMEYIIDLDNVKIGHVSGANPEF